jgi:hypothetical protein
MATSGYINCQTKKTDNQPSVTHAPTDRSVDTFTAVPKTQIVNHVPR